MCVKLNTYVLSAGRTHPRLRSVLRMTHLTAERRVCSIFYWSHVLGTKGEVIVEPMCQHALVAVSTLQLILISVRGHRAYTEKEWNTIFIDVGKQFFKSLESMAAYIDRRRMEGGQRAHERNPDHTRPPMPYKRQKR